MDEIAEAEGDVLSVSMGFAVVQCILFSITGKLPPISEHAAHEGIEQWHANNLLLFIWGLGAITGLATWLSTRTKKTLDKASMQYGLLQAFMSMMGAIIAWSL